MERFLKDSFKIEIRIRVLIQLGLSEQSPVLTKTLSF